MRPSLTILAPVVIPDRTWFVGQARTGGSGFALLARRASGWSWLVSWGEESAGRGSASRLRQSARRRGRDGRSARTGSRPSPAHGFSALSLALRRDQGRTLRPASRRFSSAALDEDPRAGKAWKAAGARLPEQAWCRASSTQAPGMPDQRLVGQRPEPHPVSTTDASGASLVRPDPHSHSQG